MRAFCAVAVELNFRRAARVLSLAQPALTAQIQKLESDLGVKLFERTTRSVQLTQAGTILLAQARGLLEHSASVEKRVADGHVGLVGTLRIAQVSNIATAELGSAIRSFNAKYPGVTLSLSDMTTPQQIDLLVKGDLDLGLVRPPLSSPELASELIAEHRMVVALPADSPLASRKRLRWKDLDGQPMIMGSPREDRYYEPFLTCCKRAGIQPQIGQSANDFSTKLWLVSCGFGSLPTSGSAQDSQRTGMVYRPLPADGPIVTTLAAWRRTDSSPLLPSFIAELRRFVHSHL